MASENSSAMEWGRKVEQLGSFLDRGVDLIMTIPDGLGGFDFGTALREISTVNYLQDQALETELKERLKHRFGNTSGTIVDLAYRHYESYDDRERVARRFSQLYEALIEQGRKETADQMMEELVASVVYGIKVKDDFSL